MEAGKDKKYNLRKLIDKSGGVFDNPMLSALVKAANSPNAIREYARDKLGWSPALSSKLRNAARIKKYFTKETWSDVCETVENPCFTLFEYDDMQQYELLISTGINLAGETLPQQHWPFFLHDFIANIHNPDKFSTFSGSGEGSFYDLSSTKEMFGFEDILFYANTYGQFTFHLLNEYYPITRFTFGSIIVQSKSVMIKPSPPSHLFPEFYKVVEINNSVSRVENERIRIFVRIEFDTVNPENASLTIGEALYKRLFRTPDNCELTFTAKFRIQGDLELLRSKNKAPKIETSLIAPYMLEELDDEDKQKCPFKDSRAASDALIDEMKQFAEAEAPSLETLAGLSLYADPPTELIDLFIK
jgi:hypothetical protein